MPRIFYYIFDRTKGHDTIDWLSHIVVKYTICVFLSFERRKTVRPKEKCQPDQAVSNGCSPCPEGLRADGGCFEMLPGKDREETVQRPDLLLHSCCGPCSTAVIERLAEEFCITVFYYNPCITDEEEYVRRRDTQKEFLEEYNRRHPGRDPVRFLEGPYRPGTFLALTRGLEDEPEGGARCEVCFRQRLEAAAAQAQMSGCDWFGTTLTVSPHKNYRKISEIGRGIALRYGLTFLDRDFKKKDGFKRSIELSKEYGLYRQNYCGCGFSKWQK